MNNILKILLIFIFFASCSFNKNSKFWSNEKIISEKQKNSNEILSLSPVLIHSLQPQSYKTERNPPSIKQRHRSIKKGQGKRKRNDMGSDINLSPDSGSGIWKRKQNNNNCKREILNDIFG